jgi:polysaccharide pyruvyl transferase WcaK-like protein
MQSVTFQSAHALFSAQKYDTAREQFLMLADQFLNPAFCTFMAGRCQSFKNDLQNAFTYYQKAVSFDDSNAFINREIEHAIVLNNLLDKNNPLIMHYAPYTTNIGDSGSIAGIRAFINAQCEDALFLSLSCRKDVYSIWKEMFPLASAIVVGGGGLYFRQPLPSGWYFPLSLDEVKSLPTPFITYSIGFNQEHSKDPLWEFTDDFIDIIADFNRHSALKSVRDAWSLRLLEKRGIHDVAIVPCPSAFLDSLPWFQLPVDLSKKIVCIAPTDRSMNPSQVSSLVTACCFVAQWLLDNEYFPLFVFHDSSDDMRLAGYLSERNLSCFLPNTAREAITIYRHAEAVIGMRGHSLILAAGQCKPILAISYNKKIDAFMETLTMTDYCLPIRCLDNPPDIIEAFKKVIEHRQVIGVVLEKLRELFFQANEDYSKQIVTLMKPSMQG